MASTRLLLEGLDIEELLARVRAEHGPGARIVHADKVRTGGVAGFFAKERYAVTVEVDPVAEVVADRVVADAAMADVAAPGSLADLADAVDAAEAAEAQVVLGTSGLPGATGLPGTTGSSASEGFRPMPVERLSTEKPDFAEVLAGLATATRDLPSAPVQQPLSTTSDLHASACRSEAGLGGRLGALGVPASVTARVEDGPDSRATLRRALDESLPPAAWPKLRAGDVLMIVGEGLAAFDVALVASKRLRLDPARVLLAAPSTLGTGIAPARRITGPADARRRSARLHRADVPTVVAVDAPCREAAAEWAREIVDALEARAVWVVVDATRKPGDLVDFVSGLGRVQGLAVRGATATRDPGTVLDVAMRCGVPTVLLEQRSGTAAAWTSLLLERLEEGDRA